MAPQIPRIISVDDHVIEPPNVWQDRLPEKFKAVGPRIERRKVKNMKFVGGVFSYDRAADDEDGLWCDWWLVEDLQYPLTRLSAAAGYPRDEITVSPITMDDMRKGCWEQKARLEDMDVNHVEASLAFPSFPRFCGQTFTERKDKELGDLCVKAYNDWMIQEWCAPSGGLNIPLCLIPLWDVELAVQEVQRVAAQGCRAICFSELPHHLQLPTIHSGGWDPLLATCNDTGVTLCMHIGSSSTNPAASPDAPGGVGGTLAFNNSMASLADWLFSAKLIQFPKLKLAYSEGQIGWIPYALERADTVWDQHDSWQHSKARIPEPPSTYYYGRVFGCFTADYHGLHSLDAVGEDNICFETDYPHTDTTWPTSKEYAEKMLADFDEKIAYKVLRGNAIKMLELDRV